MSYPTIVNKIYRSERVHFKSADPIAINGLSFDRVNGGRPLTSQALWFFLPIELVQQVVSYLDTPDLKSLALVDRDCRQLARSRLFASVVLDYSSKKWELLKELSREARARQSNGGISDKPTIGACIRYLMVRTDPKELASRHGISQHSDPGSVPCEKREEELIESYYGRYIPSIAQALQYSMPRLDRLEWQEVDGVIPQGLFMAIASSEIRHLRLSHILLGSDCEYPVQSLKPQQGWALRSLEFWPFLVKRDPFGTYLELANFARLCMSVFKEVAPTLEQLSCDSRAFLEDSLIRFPRLRALVLYAKKEVSDSVIENFFPTDSRSCAIHSFGIIGVKSVGIWKSLAKRGHIPGLEVLRLRHKMPEHEIPMTAFLAANPQIKSLQIRSARSGFLTYVIPPFLALNHRFLTSLVLTIWASEIRQPILDAIGRISSLTSLWIASAYYRHRKWIVDSHPSIATLSPLRNLTRLALTEVGSSSEFRDYELYEFHPPNYRPTGGPEDPRSWDSWHSAKVQKIVKEYMTVVKSLRWVYLGQLVHTVVGNEIVLEGGGMRALDPPAAWGVEWKHRGVESC